MYIDDVDVLACPINGGTNWSRVATSTTFTLVAHPQDYVTSLPNLLTLAPALVSTIPKTCIFCYIPLKYSIWDLPVTTEVKGSIGGRVIQVHRAQLGNSL